MDSDWYLVVIRLIHIVFGVLWVGAAIFLAGLLEPTIVDLGKDGGRVMDNLVRKRKLPVYMSLTSILTIVGGVLLYWRMSDHFDSEWLKSGPGLTLTVGSVAAIIAGVMGAAINSPTAKQMHAVGQRMQAAAGPPAAEDIAEMGRLQKRLSSAARIEAVLLLLATATMAAGRYIVR